MTAKVHKFPSRNPPPPPQLPLDRRVPVVKEIHHRHTIGPGVWWLVGVILLALVFLLRP